MQPLRPARLLGPLVIALMLALAADAYASGSILEAIAGAYSANGGTIPACEFTSAELAAAEGQAGGAGQQYAADLLAAIQRALAAQASGACAKAPTATTTTTTLTSVLAPPPVAPPPILKPPAPPNAGAPSLSPAHVPVRAISSSSGAGLPAPLWILFVAGLLAAIAGAAALAVRLGGWDPPLLARARHSWAEAGYRVSGVWADFADWARPTR